VLPIAEFGSGAPLIVVPGIQGRWEYVRPAVEALAAHFRVITFALAGEPASGLPFDEARGLDNFAEQIAAVMRERGLERAALCGISFGGLAALRFAAAAPGRVSSLVLVSTPGPGWRQARRHAVYARFPRACMPLFVGETPLRLRREIVRAIPNRRARAAFSIAQMMNLVAAPISVASLAERARILNHVDVDADCRRVSAPTLIVTGDRALDRIVPVDGTAGYARAIAGAQLVSIADTGHLGCNTRPDRFAEIVGAFLEKRDHAAA
jgi:pimeloyl-ACP methyl ester carboxylesterase